MKIIKDSGKFLILWNGDHARTCKQLGLYWYHFPQLSLVIPIRQSEYTPNNLITFSFPVKKFQKLNTWLRRK